MLKAELRGCFIGDNLSHLKVLSLHKGVINLLDQKTGHIISIIENKKNMTSMSLLIPDLFRNDPNDIIQQGDIIPFQKRYKIYLNQFSITYDNSEIWTGSLADQNINFTDSLKDLEELILRFDGENSLFSIFTEVYNTPYQYKVKEILEKKVIIEKRTILGLENLIGLGQGMTPSGDDFITGALLAEQVFNENLLIDKKRLASRSGQTTYAGATLLFQALKGSFPSYLLIFINDILRSRAKKDSYNAALKASAHGSTSGKDSIAGFYWYNQQLNINYPKP